MSGDYDDPFDDQGDEEYYDGERPAYPEPDDPLKEALQSISDIYGIDDIRDIVILVDDVGNDRISDLRAIRFSSPEEAAAYLFGIGVFAFGDVVDFGEGVYGVSIPAKTP